MAFDGITVASLCLELSKALTGGRITKIAQPEADELLLTIKNNKNQYRLLISASASLPLIYLTETNKPSPMTAPGFCMLLRKHLGGGKIIRVRQPSLERILQFEIEHLNELGDLCRKLLIVELMGKHSNLIFCREDGLILDSIKHVSSAVSSVREVLPGRTYFIPVTQEKLDPLTADENAMLQAICDKPLPLGKAIYTTLTGFSPVIAEELCHRACVDSGRPSSALSQNEREMLLHQLVRLLEDIKAEHFAPEIIYRDKEPIEFAALPLTMYTLPDEVRPPRRGMHYGVPAGCTLSDEVRPPRRGMYYGAGGPYPSGNANLRVQSFSSISALLETYYASKNTITRIRQKSSDLRRIVQTALERSRKKYDLQTRQLKDTEKREKYKVYGELLHTYGCSLKEGARSLEALNYYTNETITIPLDPQLSARENAKKYFDKYGKLKRTYEAVTELLLETAKEVEHLESISQSLDIALSEEDLVQIREELTESGYIRKRRTQDKKPRITSRPFHYLSSDGFHIYVGKNNLQNDELTFKFASGSDWWFHAKGTAGSHVILKSEGREIPDRAFEEAGRLAAYYSKNRGNEKVEIDYVEKKHVKKPGSAKPGFVVYYTNYSLVIDSDISGLTLLT